MPDLIIREETLERMIRAVEKVRNRLRGSTAALERPGVPYAVVGGNDVAAWVATVDQAAVRNTPDSLTAVVGLVDETRPARFPGELGARLQHHFDTPDE